MNTAGIYDVKKRFSELVEKAANGEETIVTRNGRPVAKLVPFDDGNEQHKRAVEAIRWMQENRHQNSLDGSSVRSLIEEGRK